MGAGQMRGHCMSPNAMKWGDTSRCVGLLRKGTEYREVNTSSERRLTHASGCHRKGKCFKCTRVRSIVSNCYPTQHNSLWHGPHIFRNLLNQQIRTHEGLQELQLKLDTLASESHQKEELFLDMRKSNAPCNRKWSWGKCPGKFVMGVLWLSQTKYTKVLLWDWNKCPLKRGRPYLRGSFIEGSTVCS